MRKLLGLCRALYLLSDGAFQGRSPHSALSVPINLAFPALCGAGGSRTPAGEIFMTDEETPSTFRHSDIELSTGDVYLAVVTAVVVGVPWIVGMVTIVTAIWHLF